MYAIVCHEPIGCEVVASIDLLRNGRRGRHGLRAQGDPSRLTTRTPGREAHAHMGTAPSIVRVCTGWVNQRIVALAAALSCALQRLSSPMSSPDRHAWGVE